MGQAIALYVGAVVGAGVLVLPGAAASIAGPASILAWGFDALLGIPLALTFGATASRYPDAGGVSTFARNAFGADLAALVGWFYLVAAAVGEIIVPLAGAHYVAKYVGFDRAGTHALAAGILLVTIGANLRGLKVGGRLALCLSAAIAIMLLVATLSAIPEQACTGRLSLRTDGPPWDLPPSSCSTPSSAGSSSRTLPKSFTIPRGTSWGRPHGASAASPSSISASPPR
jgi:amino acid efflux transporter